MAGFAVIVLVTQHCSFRQELLAIFANPIIFSIFTV